MDAHESRAAARWGTLGRTADEEAFERETSALVAQTRRIECEGCRWEIIRSGGVVGTCDEHGGTR